MEYSSETRKYIRELANKYHCPILDIKILLTKYGMPINKISTLLRAYNGSQFLLNTLDGVEKTISSNNKIDRSIEKSSNAFLNDFVNKKSSRMTQLEFLLSRNGSLLLLLNYLGPLDPRFTEKDRNVFLLKQFVINYYARNNQEGTSVTRLREETKLLQLLDMETTGRKNIEPKKIEVEQAMDFIDDDPTTLAYLARMYTQNIQAGSSKLATRIFINNNVHLSKIVLNAIEDQRNLDEPKTSSPKEVGRQYIRAYAAK